MATLQEMLASMANGSASVSVGSVGKARGRRKNASAPVAGAVQHAHAAHDAPVVAGGFLNMANTVKAQAEVYTPPSKPSVAGLEKREGRYGSYATLTVVRGDTGRYHRLSTGLNSDAAALVTFLGSLDAATLASVVGESK